MTRFWRAKKRRFAVRRRRTRVFKRRGPQRSRRRRFGKRRTRVAIKTINVHSIPEEFSLGVGGAVNRRLDFIWTIDGFPNLDYLASLRGIYEEVKIKSRTWTFNIKESDAFTENNYQQVEVVQTYDPDAEGRSLATINDFYTARRHKRKFMRYGQAIKKKLFPKFSLQSTGSGISPSTNLPVVHDQKQEWVESAALGSSQFAKTSRNAHHLFFTGSPNTVIRQTISTKYQFRKEKRFQQYA